MSHSSTKWNTGIAISWGRVGEIVLMTCAFYDRGILTHSQRRKIFRCRIIADCLLSFLNRISKLQILINKCKCLSIYLLFLSQVCDDHYLDNLSYDILLAWSYALTVCQIHSFTIKTVTSATCRTHSDQTGWRKNHMVWLVIRAIIIFNQCLGNL